MRKSIWIRLTGIGIFTAAAFVAYTQGPQPTPLETLPITDGMYYIHNPEVPGNTTVLITDEGVLLVDDKFPQDGENIVAEVRKLTDAPIKYVVNTHHHGDHSGSNPTFQKEGAIIVSSAKARERMVAGKQAGPANFAFENRAQLYLGGEPIELYQYGRAHTDGDAVVLFPNKRVLASGDIYANDPGTPELVDYAGGGSATEWPNTLTKALHLEFDQVVPGHGTLATHADMQNFRDDTAELRRTIHQMLSQGASRADVEKYVRERFGFLDFHVNMSLDGLINELK